MPYKINPSFNQAISQVIGAAASTKEDQFAIFQNLNAALSLSQQFQSIWYTVKTLWIYRCHSLYQIAARQW